eukprot:498067_1
MTIFLQSSTDVYVPVIIDVSNIDSFLIPKNSSYFKYTENIKQYVHVIFLLLHNPLPFEPWLKPHFCPNDTCTIPRKKFVTIYMDLVTLIQFKNIICSNIHNLDGFGHINTDFWKLNTTSYVCKINDQNKDLLLRNTFLPNDVSTVWKTIDLNHFQGANKDCALYIENSDFIEEPHHNNSLIYVQSIKRKLYHTDERSYWLFPAQHGHKQEPFVIRQKHMNILANNEWLDDDIINFGCKYIYALWPNYTKKNVYIFKTYWFYKISEIFQKKENNVEEIVNQTKSFDNLFDREYILIPICYSLHWYLMIVYGHNNVWNNRNKINNLSKCYLRILESLNQTKGESQHIFDNVRKWLNIMAVENGYQNNVTLFNMQNVIEKCITIPKQPQSINCGCFLLRNVYQFGTDNGINVNVTSLKQWYTVDDGVNYRSTILDIMKLLAKEQKVYVTDLYW